MKTIEAGALTDEQELLTKFLEFADAEYVPNTLFNRARALLSASKPVRAQPPVADVRAEQSGVGVAQGVSADFKKWFEREWASYEDKAISGGKIVSMAWALKGYRAATTPQTDGATVALTDEQRKVIWSAVRSLSERADELKASNTSMDGTWCDAEEQAAYDAECNLIAQLRHLLAATHAPAMPKQPTEDTK